MAFEKPQGAAARTSKCIEKDNLFAALTIC